MMQTHIGNKFVIPQITGSSGERTGPKGRCIALSDFPFTFVQNNLFKYVYVKGEGGGKDRKETSAAVRK